MAVGGMGSTSISLAIMLRSYYACSRSVYSDALLALRINLNAVEGRLIGRHRMDPLGVRVSVKSCYCCSVRVVHQIFQITKCNPTSSVVFRLFVFRPCLAPPRQAPRLPALPPSPSLALRRFYVLVKKQELLMPLSLLTYSTTCGLILLGGGYVLL